MKARRPRYGWLYAALEAAFVVVVAAVLAAALVVLGASVVGATPTGSPAQLAPTAVDRVVGAGIVLTALAVLVGAVHLTGRRR